MRAFNRLSVATKIYAVCFTGFTAALILSASWYLKEASVDASGADRMNQVDLARGTRVAFLGQVQAWKNLLIRGSNPEKFEQYGKEFFEREAVADSTVRVLATTAVDTAVRAIAVRFTTAHKELGESYRAAMKTFGESGGKDVAAADKAVAGKDRAPSALLDSAVTIVKASQEEFGVRVARQRLTILVSVSAVLLGMIPLVILMVRSGITRPIARVGEVVAQAAEGDLRGRVNATSQDEIGALAARFDSFLDHVSKAVSGITQTTFTVSAASQQLSGVAEQLSGAAQTQASSLEETAASMEEITSTVKQNAENASQANRLATTARDVAQKGGEIVGDTVSAMGEINSSSRKISEIITTIDEIAFETNLLPLCGPVEAARAGAQGRGFAVVAAEVRSLAARSASAAKEIKSLIHESSQKVEDGSQLVNSSGTSLGEIVNSVKRVSDIVAEIAAASREQSVGIEEVNRAVMQMDQVTQQNAAQTEELSATASTLAQQARDLESLVSWFKVDGSEPMGGPALRSPRKAPAASAMQRRTPRAPASRPMATVGGDDAGDGFVDF
jgi:methyl-accepting chemotaxis protein-1 (serine sensor receptor)